MAGLRAFIRRAAHCAMRALALAGPASLVQAGELALPSAMPASITAGREALVVVTIRISDPNYLAGSANLLRLKPDGTALSLLGSLRDDGQNGDAVAADNIHSIQLRLRESTATVVPLQVSAAFRGESRRRLSQPVTVSVGPADSQAQLSGMALSPGSAATGSATQVLATVILAAGAGQAATVELLRQDEGGTTLHPIGNMHDDGREGDAVAGDGIYSLRTTVLENKPVRLTYQSVARFAGDSSKLYSAPAVLPVTGSAGDITIQAPEHNAYLNTPVVTVSGSVGDAAATVTLNGIAAPLSGQRFAAAVPLIEGPNTITALVTNSNGSVASTTRQVMLDTTPPKVRVYSPAANATTTSGEVHVTGLVNDIVLGTVNPLQATVTVNGIKAEVLNRSFLARGVSLLPGANRIVVEAVDRAGNRATDVTTVTRIAPPPRELKIVSGNLQAAPVGGPLPQALQVALVDERGQPVANQPVLFRVVALDGELASPEQPASKRSGVRVATDSGGQARALWTLGSRAGSGNNRVEASAAGVPGTVTFFASGSALDASLVVVDYGQGQNGVVGQALPWPLLAVVTDSRHNRLANVPVTFSVRQGGGGFGPERSPTLRTVSDADGRVAASLVLGPDAGTDNNVVEASFAGQAGLPAVFTASGMVPGPPEQTRISGVVVDNSNQPIQGVTMRLFHITQGQRSNIPQEVAPAVRTDAQGQFLLQPVPVGLFKLMADGGTAERPGTWPTLDFDIHTVSGQDNKLGMPVYLPQLNPDNRLCVNDTTGGTLTLADAPGFALEILPGSASFAGGSRSGCVSVSTVNIDKVPMTPAFGQQPRFVVTIQPVGTHFNPPARMSLPNVDSLAPRAVTEMYSYDHDLGNFVAIGSATVSADGSTVTSDPGSGAIKAGWHGSGNPGQSGSAGTCAPCQQCQGSSCVPVADSPAFGPPNPVQIPSVNLLARDAVAMRRFGANELSDPEVTASCTQICVGGNQRFRLEGDVTARDWEIEVYADMQYPNCAKARRTSVNIQRTTTHELKHGRFLADAMNVWKRRFGSVFSSRAECESAARASINDFRNVWGAVLARQANHADFVGEQRYGFDCVNGTTVEVPLGVTY